MTIRLKNELETSIAYESLSSALFEAMVVKVLNETTADEIVDSKASKVFLQTSSSTVIHQIIGDQVRLITYL
jgi:hypothetical protein